MKSEHAQLHERLGKIPPSLRFPVQRPEPELAEEERERLQQIADLRADGNSWERTAKLLNADAKELRQFVKKAGIAFRRILARTDRELTRDGRREAMFVLRKQLRTDPDSIGARLAAQCLANIDLTFYRHRNKKPKLLGLDPENPDLQEALRFVQFQNSLKPEEAKSICRQIFEGEVSRRLIELGLDPRKFVRPPDEPPTDGNCVPREPKPPTQPENHGEKPGSSERGESPRASERLEILSPRDESPTYKPAACGVPSKTDAKHPGLCNEWRRAGASPRAPVRLSSPARLPVSPRATGVRAMSGPRLFFAALIAIVLAVPVNAQTGRVTRFGPIQPEKPAETALAAVPTDAFLFVSVRVSKLWDNPAARPLRDWYAAQKEAPFETVIGLQPADIDRVTLFKSSWNPDEGSASIVLISTRKPYNEATILKALGADKMKPQLWRQTTRRVFDINGHFRFVVFLDDRTLLFLPKTGDEKSISVNLLAQFIVRKPDGPLAAALAAASNHDFAVGVDMRGVEEFANLIQAHRSKEVIPFLALLKAKTVMLTVDVDKTARGQFTLVFPDAESAKRAGPVLEEGIKFLDGFIRKESEHERDEYGKVLSEWAMKALKSAKVTTLGANVIATGEVPFADDLAKLVAVLPKQFGVFRDEADAINNLKQLALGMHNFESAFAILPGDVVPFGDKLNAWSWRVQLLPFIEYDNLYKQLDLQKPWDDPANRKVLEAAEMPKVLELPGRPAPKNHTYFRILSLPKNAKGTDRPFFKEGARGPKFTEVTDGLSNTFMIVEAEEPVLWYKPDVLAYDGKLPLPKLGAKDADRFLAAFGDGSVRSFKPSKLGEKTIRAMITIQGGEVYEVPK
jgi:hypothetical protein